MQRPRTPCKTASKSPEEQETLEAPMEQWKLVIISIFFLYAWVWFVSLLHGMVQDEKAGRMARILFLRGSVKPYYVMHFFILALMAAASFFIALNGMLYVTETSSDLMWSWNIWTALMFMVTSMLTFFIFLLGNREPVVLMMIGMFALLSFTLQVLPFQGLSLFGWLFPHSWLIELNPWEAGGVSFDHIKWRF